MLRSLSLATEGYLLKSSYTLLALATDGYLFNNLLNRDATIIYTDIIAVMYRNDSVSVSSKSSSVSVDLKSAGVVSSYMASNIKMGFN
tara:strand:+ start:2219 stop:2482 length:264 start_codon:yes stop_codon:yes gene_type:complete